MTTRVDETRCGAPDIALVAQLSRTFMRRAVVHLVCAGVRQFLDLSVATTAVGNVHDLTEPVGLLMVSGLALLPGSTNLVKMVSGYRRSVVPGSFLVISHLSSDRRPAETAAAVQVMSSTPDPIQPRTREEVVRLFTGFELVAPGVVDAGQWHAERQLDPAGQLASAQPHIGVGRKPSRVS